MKKVRKFKRVMVANRGEIAIRIFRACHELDIRTVAIYSEEDKNTLFRTKADEAYEIGKGKSPINAYLDIEEIISLAQSKGVDAIHPGYGFLSENPDFAEACQKAEIEFIGPDNEMMNSLGDKIQSKLVASSVNVPTIPGVDAAIESEEEALRFAKECGYPIMLKAAAGGGGRGMRIVHKEENLITQYNSAKSEAKKAFGIDDIFVEKYLEDPKHIEVQVLGDKYGNLVHLFERDCSVQRRHQKVIEFTPAVCLTDEQRKTICEDAIKIASSVHYRSAGTVEFLLDKNGNHYFIEMNPRIQVEHTVTEVVTGIDIVQSQILIAEGYSLDSDEIGIKSQDDIITTGYAIQCRVTTEDPANGFAPDTGTINLYRSASGFGIRLDGGSGFTGSVISPYYDSLLVKVTATAKRFPDAIKKAERALSEMVVKGIKTNIEFLLNVLNHETFKEGMCDTGFVENNPLLVNIREVVDNELRVLDFLGERIVNGTEGHKPDFNVPKVPKIPAEKLLGLRGTKQLLDEEGPEAVSKWVHEQDKLLITDTTYRDAQQSLMATRMRSIDMEKIAPAVSYFCKDFFSLEMWGGATFDVTMRYLNENPWERLEKLRAKIPNIMFQMLIRGANAVGYKNYPDNVIRRFIKESADSGIDVFRIFDSLNWIEGMSVALDETLNQGKLAEACLCYTGDVLDKSREKYNLEYYVRNAKELERRGAHILGIKDMSGLLKPVAAKTLVTALKNEITIPIHLHTHDTSGNGVASLIMAAEAGVDIVDGAFNSMAGLTSQPGLNSLIAAMENSPRETHIGTEGLQKISEYWDDVRPVYTGFESGLSSSTAEIYRLEIPGGQYSNLKPQVESFGIGHKFNEVKEMYVLVNKMLGDIIKVTPSSKVVGDMAIFMVQNDLTDENILTKGKDMDYPDSVISYFEGMMGQPEGGFPKELQKIVLKDKKPITCRPGELLEPEDFDSIKEHIKNNLGLEGTEQEALSYAMYPKVFEDYVKNIEEKGNLRDMGSDIFFYGLREGETGDVKVREGNVYVIKLVEIRKAGESGNRDLVFSVDGNQRVVSIKDKSALTTSVSGSSIQYANTEDPSEIGASIPGTVIKVFIEVGETVKKGQPIAVIEAMKMETNVLSTFEGVVDRIYVKEGDQVKSGELVAGLVAIDG